MLAAMRNNMTDSAYVYIIPFPTKDTLDQPYPWMSTSPSSVPDDLAKKAYLSTLVVSNNNV